MHSCERGSCCVPINVDIGIFVGDFYIPIATEKARSSLLYPSLPLIRESDPLESRSVLHSCKEVNNKNIIVCKEAALCFRPMQARLERLENLQEIPVYLNYSTELVWEDKVCCS